MSNPDAHSHGTDTTSDITVSVIIATWNKSKLTIDCINRLLECIGNIACEIIVVDNGSRADQAAELRRSLAERPVRLIGLKTNLFFGEANNIGAEAARGVYLLLLNNDTLVDPGFLEPLVNALETAPKAKAVGARLLYEDRSLQEAGAYLTPDAWSIQHGKRGPANGLIAGQGVHVVDYCSAACLLIERRAFLRAAGFDPLYDPAYFEDADLCLRLRSQGHYTYYCGDSSIVHLESKTSRKLWDEGMLDGVVRQSHRKFAERWGDYLARRLQEEVLPPYFGEIDWEPEPPEAGLSLEGAGRVCWNDEWIGLVATAGQDAGREGVVFVADEPSSRCRIYSIARHLDLTLPPFSIRCRHA